MSHIRTRNQIALDEYNLPYMNLTYHQQDMVDYLTRDQIGN